MEKCRSMSVLEKYCVLIQQFAVSTLDQFVGNFESSVVLMYLFALNVTNHILFDLLSTYFQLAYFQSA